VANIDRDGYVQLVDRAKDVVKRAGVDVTRAEMLAFLAARVAKWWLPDDVVFVDSLPHTATGKLLKTELRERFKAYVAAQPS